jgi:hypothetical protein
MTTFDTIFEAAAKTAGLSWLFVFDNKDRNIKVDRAMETLPCILRSFNETLQPMFDPMQRVEREMSLYIIHVGFTKHTSEQLNINLEDIMTRFITFREAMRTAGVEVTITQKPFPNWEQTNYNEYGYVFNLRCKYSICQN